jgi:hypothetical protein
MDAIHCMLMCLQITLLCEQLIIHITGKQMLSNVGCWCTLPCERLITHITGKQMFSTVVLVCLQITMLCEQFITHITGKQMLSIVCVDVPSDYPVM